MDNTADDTKQTPDQPVSGPDWTLDATVDFFLPPALSAATVDYLVDASEDPDDAFRRAFGPDAISKPVIAR